MTYENPKATTTRPGVIQLAGDLGGTDLLPTVVSISGASPINITPIILQWITGAASATIKQADKITNSGTGALFTIQAQNETGTTSTGGGLTLTSGTGTTAAGAVVIQTGGTTRLTANASGVITIANLGIGLVHADGSGNLTSSTLVNADINSSAAIAYSKLNLSNSIVNADINSSAAIDVLKLAAGTANQILINNATPTPTWTTLSGDATNSLGVITVVKINGASVSAGGSLTTGNVLQVNGSSSLTYAPVNLAGGSNYVTGTLPIGNQANQSLTLVGDTTGVGTTASTTTTVVKVNGVSYPTSPSTNTVPVVTGTNTITYQQIANAQISSTAAIAVSKLAAGTAAQLLLNNATPTWTTVGGDSIISATGSMTNVAIQTYGIATTAPTDGYVLTWVASTSKWTPEALGNVSGIGASFGDLYSNNGTSTQVLTTSGTFYQITRLNAAGYSSNTTVSAASSNITIINSGNYEITVDLQCNTDSGTPLLSFLFFVNGVSIGGGQQITLNGTAYVDFSMTHTVPMNASDVVDVRVSSSDNSRNFACWGSLNVVRVDGITGPTGPTGAAANFGNIIAFVENLPGY